MGMVICSDWGDGRCGGDGWVDGSLLGGRGGGGIGMVGGLGIG